MSKTMADLLQQPVVAVTKAIRELETLNGHPSHDARLLAEVLQTNGRKLNQLGLDPSDTTAAELYHCLLAKYDHDSQHLDKVLGLKPKDGIEIRAVKVNQLIAHMMDLPEQWGLKNSALRKILRQQPPAKTMKKMHYRSLESMLRRQDLISVFMTATVVEPEKWRREVAKKVAAYSSADFEMHTVKTVVLPTELVKISRSPDVPLVCSPITASVALWPSNKLNQASVMTLSLLLLRGLESLGCQNSMSKAAKVNPAFRWWSDTGHLVSSHEDQPVSLNLTDAALNHLNKSPLGNHHNHEGQRNLWHQLISLYDQQPSFLTDLFKDIQSNFEVYKLKLPIAQSAPEYVEI